MIEGVVFIVTVFIIGPAVYMLAAEWQDLKAERDHYRALAVEASKRRHPSSVSNIYQLRRIK